MLAEPLTATNSLPIAVVIPVYNGANYLPRAVQSLFAPGLPFPAEVVIVDDGSTDSSPEVAAELAQRFPAVRCLRLPENIGQTRARYAGLAQSPQPFVAGLDCDDQLAPGALAAAHARLLETEAEICLFRLTEVSLDGEKTLNAELDAMEFVLTGREAARLALNGWHRHFVGVFERSVYGDAYRDVDVPGSLEDGLIALHAFGIARRVVGCDGIYLYSRTPGSLSRKPGDRWFDAIPAHVWRLNFARDIGVFDADPDLRLLLIALAEQDLAQAVRDRGYWSDLRGRSTVTHQLRELDEVVRSNGRLMPLALRTRNRVLLRERLRIRTALLRD